MLFPTVTQVEVEATVLDLPPEQVRNADVRDYGPSAETDSENLNFIQQLLIR